MGGNEVMSLTNGMSAPEKETPPEPPPPLRSYHRRTAKRMRLKGGVSKF